ncbi:MAG TPA: DUF1684 domain-containing protein, partial [Vicinamibacterales bacterium]|nr:DUF1684 domain-containing protein [Vicinamibacterales bacterium]
MSKSIAIVLAGLCLFAAAGCDSAPAPDTSDYKTKIEKARTVKDASFEAKCCSDVSPVPDDKKKDYLPLLYYPIDGSYNVPALLTPSSDKTVLQMQTSSGQPRAERRAGTLTFTLYGQQMTLTAFVEADAPNMNRLFVPFNDATSGTATYGGGRFMDLDVTPTGIYDVDFNRAYTPYCYYNPTFECPYP